RVDAASPHVVNTLRTIAEYEYAHRPSEKIGGRNDATAVRPTAGRTIWAIRAAAAIPTADAGRAATDGDADAAAHAAATADGPGRSAAPAGMAPAATAVPATEIQHGP